MVLLAGRVFSAACMSLAYVLGFTGMHYGL